MSRNIFTKAVTAVAVAAALLTASPAAAEKGETPGSFNYRPHDQHSRAEDANGLLMASAVYAKESPPGGNRLLWSLRLTPRVQAMMAGPMKCTATVDGKKNYQDHHASIPPDYFLHSTVKGLELDKRYALRICCDFYVSDVGKLVPANVTFVHVFKIHSS